MNYANIINNALKASTLARYANHLNGVAWPAQEGEKIFPVVRENGEFFKITPDDSYDLILWHRVNGNSYQLDGQQFGGSNNRMLRTIDGYLVVCARNFELTPDELEQRIVSGLPDEVKDNLPDGVDRMAVNVRSSVLSPMQVWGTEWIGYDFALGAEDVLIRINYTVDMRFRKNCQQC